MRKTEPKKRRNERQMASEEGRNLREKKEENQDRRIGRVKSGCCEEIKGGRKNQRRGETRHKWRE